MTSDLIAAQRQGLVPEPARRRIRELERALIDLLKYHAPRPIAGADARTAQIVWNTAVKVIS